ncbi:phosphoribosylformylglycinamidine synthase subunit PurQ [Henriciella algicola]|uniref:Phosphoribosylformylglycinamidine synthase subunit PurQ n=1 Tax=Henriciella algicola TaxID=1608422 RepID=A0A399RHU4_9PROT|nr:phosphoribosylformylglycinamidine synthase subunit PurQ [Henriciella algicola]RIJ31186.1 phosphoribosylformylglycinamidine synthase subunit PurQ [Henriciella algicola]
MKSAVIVFPGSNCDRDAQTALTEVMGTPPEMVWHKDGELPQDLDLVVVPGGFSYGDYLRCGAMAANSPVIEGLRRHADRGGYVLGVCNGFQVLTETQLLPGALLRNAGLDFVCRPQPLRIETSNSAFTSAYGDRAEITIPIAHHDGNYVADEETLDRIEGEGRVAFRYSGNPNGSARDIAGVLSENGRVLGLMPHPERAIGGHEGGDDGRGMFESLLSAI